jgi:hypothetical protein
VGAGCLRFFLKFFTSPVPPLAFQGFTVAQNPGFIGFSGAK